MPFKIDIQTNINDHDLTLEACSEIISTLQTLYSNIRKDFYSYFLGLRSLKKAIIFAVIILFVYFLTEDSFFIYLMPISVTISLFFSLMSAEYLASKSRKQIYEQIQHYMSKREMLLKDQKIKV